MKQTLLWLLLFVLTTSPAFAWSTRGHMLVAKIAYDQLEPEVRIKVDQDIHALDSAYPKSDFVKAAAWADWIKYDEVRVFDSWHYIDMRANENQHNIVWAIGESERILSSKKANSFEKGLFLRFLLHFVGDIHQPLHCMSFYSQAFPEGDKGGNLFYLPKPNKNLHHLWDGGLGLFANDFSMLVKKIELDFPPTSLAKQLEVLDPSRWAQEGVSLAKGFVYQTPRGETPAHEYIQQGQVIAEKQVALAGYRLAALLNSLYHGQKHPGGAT